MIRHIMITALMRKANSWLSRRNALSGHPGTLLLNPLPPPLNPDPRIRSKAPRTFPMHQRKRNLTPDGSPNARFAQMRECTQVDIALSTLLIIIFERAIQMLIALLLTVRSTMKSILTVNLVLHPSASADTNYTLIVV